MDTSYTLEQNDAAISPEVEEYVAKHEGMLYAVGWDGSGGAEGYCSWEECDVDMRGLSVAFPGQRFTLTCEDGGGECWQEHYLDGRAQVCSGETVYEPFKASKLR